MEHATIPDVAPILLGGGTFEVDERLVAVDEPRERSHPPAVAILSAVVVELRLARYETTPVDHKKRDWGEFRCVLGGPFIKITLRPEKHSGGILHFELVAWGFKHGQASGEELAYVWNELYSAIARAIAARLGGSQLTRLSADELDARCATVVEAE